MERNVLEIQLISDKICRYLPTKELLTVRRLNRHWNTSTVQMLKEREAEIEPMVRITNFKFSTKSRDIATHLKFLADRKDKSIKWIRNYKLDIFMDGSLNNSELSIPEFLEECVKLTAIHGQKVLSLDLKYYNMSDVLLAEVLSDPQFQRLFTGLKEIRIVVARLHHTGPNDPQHLVETLNSIPNLTRLTLRYTRMFQQFFAESPCDYFVLTLSKLNRLSKLEHLTISLNNLSLYFVKDLQIMQSLKYLKIVVQCQANFNRALFEFLRRKCPSLRELYLIRVGPFPYNEPDWLEQTRKFENEFPNIKVVVQKRL